MATADDEVLVDWLTATAAVVDSASTDNQRPGGQLFNVVGTGLPPPITTTSRSSNDVSQSLILRITLNRPRRGNAINQQMAQRLLRIYASVRQLVATNPAMIRFILLTGAGKYFCSGMDMKQRTSSSNSSDNNMNNTNNNNNNSDGGEDDAVQSQRLFSELAELPVPTVCVLNGSALGGGCGLMFCCDIRISSSDQHWLALTESNRGLAPALISPWIVRQLPHAAVSEMMFGGGRISVKRLWHWGVVNCVVVPSSEFPPPTHDSPVSPLQSVSLSTVDQALWHYWKMIDRSGPLAVQLIKRLIRRVGLEGAEWSQDLQAVRGMFKEMLANEEAVYGMMAFLQRQPANWAEYYHDKRVQSKL